MIEEILVTPAMAEEWMRSGGANRRLARSTVTKYAEIMRRGHWRLGTDAIAFNEAGELVNGQHRLAAVLASGTDQRFYVVHGLDNEAMLALDIGRRRTVIDFLGIQGISGDRSEASAYRVLLILRRVWSGEYKAWPTGGASEPDMAEVIELAQEIDIRATTQMARKINSALRLPTGLVAALLYTFSEQNPDRAEEFGRLLCDGADLVVGNPIYRLRALAMTNALSRRQFDREFLAAHIIKAWNLWMAGDRNLKLLSWKRQEGFPVPGTLGRGSRERLSAQTEAKT